MASEFITFVSSPGLLGESEEAGGRSWELKGQDCCGGASGIGLSREGGCEQELETAALASSHKGIVNTELSPPHKWDHRRAEEEGK